MRVLPTNRKEMLTWFETHVPVWNATAATIGLDPAQVSQLSTYIAAAHRAFETSRVSSAQKLADTQAYYDATDLLKEYGADLIKVIKAFAESTSTPSVYTTAKVPQPAPRQPSQPSQPRPAPTPAVDVRALLLADGTIEVSWTGTMSCGAFYEIHRRTSANGAFTIVGATDTCSFIDQNVVPATNQIAYQVFTKRDGQSSAPTAPTAARTMCRGLQGVWAGTNAAAA